MLFLFPLHIYSKYQDYASSPDKRNIIQTSIQTQRINLKEVCASRSTKIYYREVQNKEGNLPDESSKDTLLSKANNNNILKCHTNDFWGYLKLNTLSLNFAMYNILNNSGNWQSLNQEKISVWKKIFLKRFHYFSLA